MRHNKKAWSLFLVIVMLISNLTVFGAEMSEDVKWIEGPSIRDSNNSKKIEVYGRLEVPAHYKGNTKISLEVNGSNVNPNKDGSFTKSISKATEIEIKVFTGKEEIADLGRSLIYLEDSTRVEEVKVLIDNIPYNLTLSDELFVIAARDAFEALSDLEKELVDNILELEKAEAQIIEIEEKLQELEDVILLSEGKSPADFADESWIAFEEALARAKMVNRYNKATLKDIELVLSDLLSALEGLTTVQKSKVHVSLLKDSTSVKIDFDNIDNFYIKNIATGREYRDGSSPWNRKDIFEMKDIPVGEYTIHFDMLDDMYTDRILLGEVYKETVYNSKSNPLVVVEGKTNYIKIILRSDIILKEIKPVDDLIVSKSITLEEFLDVLPKQTTIIDSSNNEHKVDLKWDVRPFVFDNWKKPSEVRIWSEFFKLPINVSNTDPSTRLDVVLKIIFTE